MKLLTILGAIGAFREEKRKSNEPHLHQVEIFIPLSLLLPPSAVIAGTLLSQCLADFANAQIQVIPQRQSAHDEPHVEGTESRLELAGAEMVFGHVEAGH